MCDYERPFFPFNELRVRLFDSVRYTTSGFPFRADISK